MHEMSLMADLMRKLQAIATEHGSRLARVKVVVGALCHCSAEHFREHFAQCAVGTPAEGAELDVVVETDFHDPHAQDVILDSVEVVET